MKFRPQRGSLGAALESVVDIKPTKEALVEVAKKELEGTTKGELLTPELLNVEYYGFDERINWNTHIVTIFGYGVLGFTDGPIED